MKYSFLLFICLFKTNFAFPQVILREIQPKIETLVVSTTNAAMELAKKKRGESNKFTRRFEIEFRKMGGYPKPKTEKIESGFRVIVNENQKIDSIFYHNTILKIDTAAQTIKFEEITNFDKENQDFLISVLKKTVEKSTIKLNLGKPYSFGFRYSSTIMDTDFLRGYKDINSYLASISQDTKSLDLSKLHLKTIPRAVRKFKNLEALNLSYNDFTKLRLNPKKYPKLHNITLSNNLLDDKRIFIRRNKSLKIINLSFNDIDHIPTNLMKCQNLEDLILSNNFIGTLEKIKFSKFTNLKMLNLYQNELEAIPASIKELPKIETLDFYHNRLKFFPNEISELKTLICLAASNNQLWQLPSTLNQLINLKELYLHHNKLDSLPMLPNGLLKLDIGFNLYKSTPKVLKKLSYLAELDISNNNLAEGQNEFLLMNSLKTLYIINNDFKSNEKNYAEFQKVILELKKKSILVR
jgi:Leucine-rich repeat (LRR) protein